MLQFTEAKLGRAFILRLHDGDRLPDIIESFAAENKISNAICFFLGGAKGNSRVVVGPKKSYDFPPEPMVMLLEGVHEAFGVGTIIKDEKGKPKLHMHTSFGRKEKTVTGCVRMGIEVWQIGEVVVLELLRATALRSKDKATGFEFLEVQ
jgi:predicted DNA-binding protein with PD1-like motif